MKKRYRLLSSVALILLTSVTLFFAKADSLMSQTNNNDPYAVWSKNLSTNPAELYYETNGDWFLKDGQMYNFNTVYWKTNFIEKYRVEIVTNKLYICTDQNLKIIYTKYNSNHHLMGEPSDVFDFLSIPNQRPTNLNYSIIGMLKTNGNIVIIVNSNRFTFKSE
jgi:hypothetical protein